MIVLSHIFRLVLDLMLLGIMLHLDLYEFTSTIIFLIIVRLVVGHAGRIFQHLFGSLDDMEGLIVGLIANGIKTILESVILFSLYDVPTYAIVSVVICILGRNGFEAVSLCEDFSD